MEKRFIHRFNELRLERHEICYGLEKVTVDLDDAKETIQVAGDFIIAIEKLLK